jgi:hypothetical protein
MGEQSVVPPADLARRVEQAERRQDRLEGEVSSLVKSVDGLTDKLSGFLREYNQRSRTDWKTIIALIGALGTIGTAAIGGAIWIIMTIEGGREERLLAVLASLRDSQAAASSRQADVDGRIIEDYRREADALSGRLSRLEAAHMRGPDR